MLICQSTNTIVENVALVIEHTAVAEWKHYGKKRIQFVTYLHANGINAMSAVLFSLHRSIGLKRCRLLD